MRIYSDHVQEETRQYYTVRFPETATEEEKTNLRRELEVYRRAHYGDDAESVPLETLIETVDDENWIVLRVPGSTSITGFAWNTDLFDDIVPASDLFED